MKNLRYAFKVLLIGPAAVGKTSLMHRFTENRFAESYKTTIGVDFLTKEFEFDTEKSAQLTIWDLGGQEKYVFLRPNFFENASGALLVFDLIRPRTFLELNEWINDLKKYVGNIPFVMLGNKSDLIEQMGINGSSIEQKEIDEFIQRHNGSYYKTSAKSGENVIEAFTELTNKMVTTILLG